jgi:hypothetical protein
LTQRDYAYNIIFAFTIPFVAVIRTIKSKSARYKHQLLTLLIGLYGSTISLDIGNDGYRHLAMVSEIYANMPFKQFFYEIFQILTFQLTDSRAQDLYKHFLSFLCGAVLEMPFLFFPIVALVYGYFFSGSVLEVLKGVGHLKFKYHKLFWCFVILFVIYKNVEGINTVRTWTGLWVLVYACLKYYRTRELKYLFLMFIPPFIHFGYFILALPAYAVLVLGNRNITYAVIFVLSSFFSFINPAAVTENLQETELGEHRSAAYSVEEKTNLNEQYENQVAQGNTWYRQLQKLGVQTWAVNILCYILIFSGVYLKKMTSYQKRLFSIGIMTLALSNVTWFLSAVTNRSAIVGAVFVLLALVLYWKNNTKEVQSNRLISYGLSLSLLLFIPFYIYQLSNTLGYISFYNLLAPFAVWIEPDVNMSVRDFVKVVIGMKSL